MSQILGIISGVISAICLAPYIRDILARKTKPERASWLIWSVLGGISFFSQLAKGASDSLWMTGVQTIVVLVVFVLSIKFGSGGLSSRDIKALLVAMSGLLIWYFTQEASWALYIVIIVDAVGAILTMIKAYEDPSSETTVTWFLSGLAGLISAFSVGSWNFILLVYPLYIFIIDWMVVGAIKISPNKHLNKS